MIRCLISEPKNIIFIYSEWKTIKQKIKQIKISSDYFTSGFGEIYEVNCFWKQSLTDLKTIWNHTGLFILSYLSNMNIGYNLTRCIAFIILFGAIVAGNPGWFFFRLKIWNLNQFLLLKCALINICLLTFNNNLFTHDEI